jgi:outer membrane protein OmpA-like peptidoglycan-associated protein
MDVFTPPPANHGTLNTAHRSAWRRLFASWSLILLFLAFLVLGCKKSAPRPETAPAPQSAAPTQPTSDTGAATPGGGSVTSNAADQPGSLADRLKAVQEGPPPDPATQIHLPSWKPVSATTSSIQIPAIVGLVADAVITCKYGDLESIRSITGVSPTSMTVELAGEVIVKTPPPPATSPVTTRHNTGTRIVDVADLATAHHLMHYFHDKKTEHFPGSTPMTISTDIVNRLRSGQTVPFDYQIDPEDLLNATFSGHPTISEALTSFGMNRMLNCPLSRAEPTDVSIPVLVNDVPTELPAIHAVCIMNKDEQANFYILDQPSNALLLATQVAPSQDRSQIIKISWPQAPPPGKGPQSSMETSLADKKPVEIYGIYFDFSSSEIKPESEAVLKQIAGILQRNPTWKLNVSGHTDNVGDQAYNLGLSQRRAAAVKDALVSRYKVSPDRLATTGFGSSHPIESNGTFEGRARNRRVELQRQ